MINLGSRLSSLLLLASLVLPLLAHSSTASDDRAKPPHFVYILSDDLGANDAVFFRKHLPRAPFPSPTMPDALTPHLDEISEEALTLALFYTSPICTPTRSSLLTGRMPYHIGTQHSVIHDASPW
jgi:arylsulfatase A-like enzyme